MERLEDDVDDFLLGDSSDVGALLSATSEVQTLKELTERTIVDRCQEVFAAAVTRQDWMLERASDGDGDGFLPLLPEQLVEVLRRELTARRLWTDENFEFTVRRLTDRIDVSCMSRLKRVSKIVSDPSLARHIRTLRLHRTNLSEGLQLHDRPYLEEVVLDSSLVHSVSIKDCPLLQHIAIESTQVRRMHVERCPAIESFTFRDTYPVDDVVSSIVAECKNLKRLIYSLCAIGSWQETPLRLCIDGRETQLEELLIKHRTMKELSLTGGSPQLTTLVLQSCRNLDTVRIVDGSALSILRMEYIRTDLMMTTTTSSNEEEQDTTIQPSVKIDNARNLRHVTMINVNVDYLECLSNLSDALEILEIKHSCRGQWCPSASDIVRLLRGGPTPLLSLRDLELELVDGVDGFVLDESFMLLKLANILVKGSIRNVTISRLPALFTVVLFDTERTPFELYRDAQDESNSYLVDGRVEITAEENGTLYRIGMANLRVRELRIDCPSLVRLTSEFTYIPPEEGDRWPTALPRLSTVTVTGLSPEVARRFFSHVPYLYYD